MAKIKKATIKQTNKKPHKNIKSPTVPESSSQQQVFFLILSWSGISISSQRSLSESEAPEMSGFLCFFFSNVKIYNVNKPKIVKPQLVDQGRLFLIWNHGYGVLGHWCYLSWNPGVLSLISTDIWVHNSLLGESTGGYTLHYACLAASLASLTRVQIPMPFLSYNNQNYHIAKYPVEGKKIPLRENHHTISGHLRMSIFQYYCCCLVAPSCLTLCDRMDYSLPGSSVCRISQARILEWVAIAFSRRSSQPRDWTCISCIGRWILYHWAAREAQFNQNKATEGII